MDSRHERAQITFLRQGRGELESARSVADNLADRAGVVKLAGGTTQPIQVYLSRFGFSAEDQCRGAGTLSSGERNRLLPAKAMLQPANLLVLDEPTNDLDIPTLQNLEEAPRASPAPCSSSATTASSWTRWPPTPSRGIRPAIPAGSSSRVRPAP